MLVCDFIYRASVLVYVLSVVDDLIYKMPRVCKLVLLAGTFGCCFLPFYVNALQQAQKQEKQFLTTIVEVLSHMWSMGR
ncbi:hypothetical protein MKX01_022874 [Papaver californicum]|nr:hypothetical protein MKX01_022874 [Papaver californicum]